MHNISKCKLEFPYELSEDFLDLLLSCLLAADHGYVTDPIDRGGDISKSGKTAADFHDVKHTARYADLLSVRA